MPDLEKTSLPQKSTYQIRAVTYEVTAHFNEEQQEVTAKIKHLLCTEVRKTNEFAHLHDPK